ncbi:MAG: sensor histidine kinase [Gammaproteobacteria bacterium]
MTLPVARATDRLFIPNFCTARPVFVLVLMTELLAIVLTLSTATDVNASFDDLALKSLFIQWVTLCCAAVLCASRTFYARFSEASVAMVAYLSMLAITWLLSELAWWTLDYLSDPMPLGAASRGGFLARNLAIAAIVIAIALRYMYVHHHWERRIESESEARLQALQARMRPHFFFNCMNTIASLTRSHPKLAEEAVEDLADLFRASLLPARDRVTLGGELDLCRQYLRIEALRLQDRLAIAWQVDELPADALVPVLSIQPLIENAIYHGIEPLPRGGVLRIRGQREGYRLTVVIENQKPADGRRSSRASHGFAQENVGQRLQAFYGGSGGLTVEDLGDHYRATLSFPYEGAEDADPHRR